MLMEDLFSIIGGVLVLCLPLFGVLAIHIAEHHRHTKKKESKPEKEPALPDNSINGFSAVRQTA